MHVAVATAVAVLAAGVHLNAAADARSEGGLDQTSTAADEHSGGYTAEEQAAVAEAAAEYSSGDVVAAAALAEAASTEDGVGLGLSPGGFASDAEEGEVNVQLDGAVVLEAEGLPPVTVSAPEGASEAELVNGAVVYSDVAPSTDLVTRATTEGVQLVAILGDESAPTEIEFPVDLPAGAELRQQSDGSLAVFAEIGVEKPVAGEDARLDAEIRGVLGTSLLTDGEPRLTGAQWAALDAIAPVKTELVSQVQQVAAIEAPWAVDANGEALETRYEVTAEGIVQVVETDSRTAFPVTADPSVTWWAGHIVACATEIGLFALAGAKVVTGAVKLIKYIKGLKKTSKVAKAWSRLMKYGNGGGTFAKFGSDFAKFGNAMVALLKKLAKSGWKAMKAYSKTSPAWEAAFELGGALTGSVAELLGLGNCFAVVRAIV
jgi:hypothetical protein